MQVSTHIPYGSQHLDKISISSYPGKVCPPLINAECPVVFRTQACVLVLHHEEDEGTIRVTSDEDETQFDNALEDIAEDKYDELFIHGTTFHFRTSNNECSEVDSPGRAKHYGFPLPKGSKSFTFTFQYNTEYQFILIKD
ncbi:hypothetical protein TNCV_3894491 [Trichonephila clavipes]|nr:hypothetical protein TNCV_3894491 [Trichonephila clavipes]